MTRFDTTLAHGAKVALFIFGSVLLYGIYAYLTHTPGVLTNLELYTSIGMINTLLAMFVKFFNLSPSDFPPVGNRR